jgi:predicted nucleic acid-binding protein
MIGLTLDTGALVALERRDARMTRVFAAALADGLALSVPTVVVAEWWRASSAPRRRILDALRIEAPDVATAKAAGEALAIVGPGPSVVDATVMAAAARRGDIVYTSDVDDLARLGAVFRNVRVLRV